MSDQVTEISEGSRLVGEVERLRAHVADLQERVALLDRLAHQDVLMALPNRRGFMRELERLVARTSRYGGSAAMLYVDLNGLKMINDTFGHQAGDEALIEVAGQLTKGVRRSDIVARIGGDEFGILLEQADLPCARETGARLDALISACHFTHDGDTLPLSVAIGIAMIDGTSNPAEVMAQADEEMYRRKVAA